MYSLVQSGIKKIKAEHLPEEEEKKRIEEMIDAMCMHLEKFSEKGTINFLSDSIIVYRKVNSLSDTKTHLGRKELLKIWLREYEDSLKANAEGNRQEGRADAEEISEKNGSYDEDEVDL